MTKSHFDPVNRRMNMSFTSAGSARTCSSRYETRSSFVMSQSPADTAARAGSSAGKSWSAATITLRTTASISDDADSRQFFSASDNSEPCTIRERNRYSSFAMRRLESAVESAQSSAAARSRIRLPLKSLSGTSEASSATAKSTTRSTSANLGFSFLLEPCKKNRRQTSNQGDCQDGLPRTLSANRSQSAQSAGSN